jgi:hypothetical protein
MKLVARGFSVFLFALVFGAFAWTWGSLKYVYASGERAGYLQKFSRKGWFCKTWEGELAMVTLPGTAPEIFRFSVPDKALGQTMSPLVGQRVALHYEQHKGIPSTCFGETQYFVTSAQPVGQQLP